MPTWPWPGSPVLSGPPLFNAKSRRRSSWPRPYSGKEPDQRTSPCPKSLPPNGKRTTPPSASRPSSSMTYGRGTVVGVLGDGLWRWSLLPPDKQNLHGFYDTFWSNLVRWLSMGGEFSPDQQVALHLSRTTVRLGDPLAVDVVYKHTPATGAHPKLEVTNPGNQRRESRWSRSPHGNRGFAQRSTRRKRASTKSASNARHAAAPPVPAVQCL